MWQDTDVSEKCIFIDRRRSYTPISKRIKVLERIYRLIILEINILRHQK